MADISAPHGDTPLLEMHGIVKSFPGVRALDGVDLDVRAGEVFGFLGPNGAGKSTTIKILCTLVRPTGGTAAVAGFDVAREPREVRRRIGLVFQEPTLDGYLSADQNLRFHAELYGVPRAETASRPGSGRPSLGPAESGCRATTSSSTGSMSL